MSRTGDTTIPRQDTVQNGYGLHRGALGPLETLAQSVSAMAPSTSPSLTVPLVYALAGNGTWLVYLLATATTLLVGFCVSRFARQSASPGSLYSYVVDGLPPACGAIAGWGLLLAYLATGASVAGGALYYATLLAQQFVHVSPPSILLLVVICAGAGYIAYRDIKLSAEVMLWIECASIALVATVFGMVLFRTGPHIDIAQLRLTGVHFSALGPAVVLAVFSFVGFESATTLGVEARDPLRTIPRSVLQCAAFAGIFLMLCSYSEVLGYRGMASGLSETSSPLHLLAEKAGVSLLGVGLDVGAVISMFACVLACTTAAARVFLRMSGNGLMPLSLQRTSSKHGTPGPAILLSAALMCFVAVAMFARGINGFEIYDLAGSLSVFGFLTAYGLVALAAISSKTLRAEQPFVVPALGTLTILVIILITALDLRSSTDVLHARIPYAYFGYLLVGLGSSFAIRKWTDPVLVDEA